MIYIYIYTILHTYIICKEYKIYIHIYVLFFTLLRKWRKYEMTTRGKILRYYKRRVYMFFRYLLRGYHWISAKRLEESGTIEQQQGINQNTSACNMFNIWHTLEKRGGTAKRNSRSVRPQAALSWLLSSVFSCRGLKIPFNLCQISPESTQTFCSFVIDVM